MVSKIKPYEVFFFFFGLGEIEKTWLQNPSHINEVFLSLKTL